MENNRIRKNYIYNVSYQILILIVPLITMPYISRVLGADGIGTVSFAQSVVAYFTLFAAMGISTYGQREISYVQNDKHRRSVVFWETKLLSFIVAGIVCVFYFIFLIFTDNSALYLILSMSVFAVLVDITWFFQGMENFGSIVLRNTLAKVLGVVFVFLFVKTKSDVNKYAFSLVFFTLLGNISMWAELPRYIERVPFSSLKPFSSFSTVISLFIPTIAIQIYTVLDKTMLGLITGDSFENGYYEQSVMIAKMALAVVTALGTVLIPRIGFYFEQKDTQNIKRLMYRGYKFVWFIGIPMCFGMIAVSKNFVPWFYGPGYEKVADLLNVLSFLILAIGINNVTGMQYLIPTKQQNIFTKTVLIGAATNVALNAVLIYYFKSIGAAIASVAAETVIAIVQLYIVRHEFSWREILKSGKNYYISGIIMFALLLIIGNNLTPSILHTILMIIIGGGVYFLLLFIFKDEFFINNLKSVLNKLKHS